VQVVKIDRWRWDALLGEAKLDLLRSLAGDDGDLLGTDGDLGGVEVGLATVHDVPLIVGEEGSGLLSSLTDKRARRGDGAGALARLQREAAAVAIADGSESSGRDVAHPFAGRDESAIGSAARRSREDVDEDLARGSAGRSRGRRILGVGLWEPPNVFTVTEEG
jgi:hypothetical protein